MAVNYQVVDPTTINKVVSKTVLIHAVTVAAVLLLVVHPSSHTILSTSYGLISLITIKIKFSRHYIKALSIRLLSKSQASITNSLSEDEGSPWLGSQAIQRLPIKKGVRVLYRLPKNQAVPE